MASTRKLYLLAILTASSAFGQGQTPFKVPNSAGSATGAVWLQERRTNGSNWIKLQAPQSIAADFSLDLPVADGAAGECITTNGSGVLSWGSCGSVWTVSGSDVYRASGLVGIGAVAPSGVELYLKPASGDANMLLTDSSSTTGIQLYASSGFSVFGNTTAHPLIFTTNGTERMRLDSSGLLGVGTTSPLTPLDVTHTTSGTTDSLPILAIVRKTSGTAATGMGGYLYFVNQDAGGSLIGTHTIQSTWSNAAAGNRETKMLFTYSKANVAYTAMAIDTDGNLGIGTTTPASKLQVAGLATVTGLTVNTGAATTGYVWTATSSGGAGSWQAPAAPTAPLTLTLGASGYSQPLTIANNTVGLNGSCLGVAGHDSGATVYTLGRLCAKFESALFTDEIVELQTVTGSGTYETALSAKNTVVTAPGSIVTPKIGRSTSAALTFYTDATDRWEITSAGMLLPKATDTYDAGSSSVIIRTVYAKAGEFYKSGSTASSDYVKTRKINVMDQTGSTGSWDWQSTVTASNSTTFFRDNIGDPWLDAHRQDASVAVNYTLFYGSLFPAKRSTGSGHSVTDSAFGALGSASRPWADLRSDDATFGDDVAIGDQLTVTGDTTFNGATNTFNGFVDMKGAGINYMYGTLAPQTNNTGSIGTSGARYANFFGVAANFSGVLTLGSTVTGSITPTASSTYNIGSSSVYHLNIYGGYIEPKTELVLGSGVYTRGDLLPATNITYTLGNSSFKWSAAYINNAYFYNNIQAPNGSNGQSTTITVRDSAGTGTCTIIFSGGLKTGGTC